MWFPISATDIQWGDTKPGVENITNHYRFCSSFNIYSIDKTSPNKILCSDGLLNNDTENIYQYDDLNILTELVAAWA